MSLSPSAPRVPAKRKVLQIRPAVPLIYERRGTPGADHSSLGKGTSHEVIKKNVKNGADSSVDGHSMQGPREELRSKSASEQSPQIQNESTENTQSPIGEKAQDDQETEKAADVSDILQGEFRGQLNGEDQEMAPKAENCSKNTDQESPTVCVNLPSSIESSPSQSKSEATNTMSSPESLQDVQSTDHTGRVPPQRSAPNGWIPSPHELHAQPEILHGWIRGPEMRGIGGLPPPTPSSSVDDGNTPIDPQFVDHILSSFNEDRYADISLTISHDNARFKDITFSLHRVLVFRSEALRKLGEMSTNDHNVSRLDLRLSLCDRFITPKALAFALCTCYGQTASTFPSTWQHRVGNHSESANTEMTDILAFAAAGHLLKLEEVALQALEKAKKVISWENLVDVLSYGLESCIHRCGSVEATLLQPFAYSKSDGDRFPIDTARYMLNLSLGFAIAMFPDTWVFDRTAKPLEVVDRLPINGTISVPRDKTSELHKIQFGQRPVTVDSQTSNLYTFISSIVLSIPIEQLRMITLANIPSVLRQLPQIIAEREQRRLTALNSDVPWDQRRLARGREWHWVGFEERIFSPHGEIMDFSCSSVSMYRTTADEKEAEIRDQTESS